VNQRVSTGLASGPRGDESAWRPSSKRRSPSAPVNASQESPSPVLKGPLKAELQPSWGARIWLVG
jgi:hypothetical protein